MEHLLIIISGLFVSGVFCVVCGILIDKEPLILIGIGMVIATLCTFILIGISNVNPYRQGQIDALNGKIKYELQVQPDSSRIWVPKK